MLGQVPAIQLGSDGPIYLTRAILKTQSRLQLTIAVDWLQFLRDDNEF